MSTYDSTPLELAIEKIRAAEFERQKRYVRELIKTQKKKQKLKKHKEKRSEPLAQWQYYLKERQQMSKRIMKYTGKKRAQILINYSGATEKAMLQKLLQQAEILSPDNRWRKIPLRDYRTKCDLNLSLPDEELLRSLVMIFGLPTISKKGLANAYMHAWLKSKVIMERLREKRTDISNVIEYFPDLQNLQVVGKAIQIHQIEPETIVVSDIKSEKIGFESTADEMEKSLHTTSLENEANGSVKITKFGSMGKSTQNTSSDSSDEESKSTQSKTSESKTSESKTSESKRRSSARTTSQTTSQSTSTESDSDDDTSDTTSDNESLSKSSAKTTTSESEDSETYKNRRRNNSAKARSIKSIQRWKSK